MGEPKDKASLVFSDADELLLLQLATRREIANRHASEEKEPGDETPPSIRAKAEATEAVPTRWRLVPADTDLYDWQKECLPLWLKDGRGTVKVATGGGKTLFALAAAQRLQNEVEPDLRVIIVVPTIHLMFQWLDEVLKGNLPRSAVGLMGGGQKLPPLDSLRILICVINSARDKLSDLVQPADWLRRSLLIVDECHRAAAEHASRIFSDSYRFSLGLSATPEKDPSVLVDPDDSAYDESVVGRSLGPIIYDFSIQRSSEAGLLTSFEVWHIGVPLSPQEAAEHSKLSKEIGDLRKPLQARHARSRSRQGFIAWCQSQASRGGPVQEDASRFIGLANRRKRLLYSSSARVTLALSILTEAMAEPRSRAIVFHELIRESEKTFLAAVVAKIPAVLEHSQLPDGIRTENIEAFRRGIARVIVSAKSLIEGFNVPSADIGIIMASTGGVRQRIQTLGRMLRRKPDEADARIYVFYVPDTQDEAIYEKADWESVIGAKRNRYFNWRYPVGSSDWTAGLSENPEPPREYKPPSWEVDVSNLSLGDRYPGSPRGTDLKVDDARNLRMADSELISAPRNFVDAIVERTRFRRARLTPAGHLIVRIDEGGGKGAGDWRYVGVLDLPTQKTASPSVRLDIRAASGKRRIFRRPDRGSRRIPWALGPGEAKSSEAAKTLVELLEWIGQQETRCSCKINTLFWDGGSRYWLEIAGERIPFDRTSAPLEFAE